MKKINLLEWKITPKSQLGNSRWGALSKLRASLRLAVCWVGMGVSLVSCQSGMEVPGNKDPRANGELDISAGVEEVNQVRRSASCVEVFPFGDDGVVRSKALVVASVQADAEVGNSLSGVAVSVVELSGSAEGGIEVGSVGAMYLFSGIPGAEAGDWIRILDGKCSRGVLISFHREEKGLEVWLFEPGEHPRELSKEVSGLDKRRGPGKMVGWDGGDGKGTRLLGTFYQNEKEGGGPAGLQEVAMYRGGEWSAVEFPKRKFELNSNCTDLRIARAGSVCKAVGTLASRTRFGSVFEFDWGERAKFVDVASAYPEFEHPGRESSEAFINPLYDNGLGASEYDGFGVILNKGPGYPAYNAHLTPVEWLKNFTLARLSMKTGFEPIHVSVSQEVHTDPEEVVQVNSALLSGLDKVGYLIKYQAFGFCTIAVIPMLSQGVNTRSSLVMANGGQLLGSHTVMLGIPDSHERVLFAPSGHIIGMNVPPPKRGQMSTVFLDSAGIPTSASSVDWEACASSSRVILLQ